MNECTCKPDSVNCEGIIESFEPDHCPFCGMKYFDKCKPQKTIKVKVISRVKGEAHEQ